MNQGFKLGAQRVVPLFALLLASRLAHAEPPAATEARSVPAFQGIELAGVIDVQVTIGSPASVAISGEAELLDKVITRVKNGVLVIETKPRLPRNTHLRATITAPDLTSLALSGVGDLRVSGIANDSLALDLSGVGSLKVTGSTGSLRVHASGTGDVSAKDLVAKSSTVVASGVGDTRVQATQSLDATLSGVGEINVYGHPQQIKKSRSGIGDIHIH
jgi:hypothetical protein